MIDFINSWAQEIIVAVVIATIIEIIIPEGNNKKYIKTVVGIYILFVIVYPLISKFGKSNINFNSIIVSSQKELSKYSTNKIEINTNAFIERTYEDRIKEEIENSLKEKGYKVININIEIETKDEKNYGLINKLYIKIAKEIKNDNEVDNNKTGKHDANNNKIDNINSIKKIDIDLSKSNDTNTISNIDTNNSNKNNNPTIVTDVEINELKEYLSNMYGVKKDNILIEQ